VLGSERAGADGSSVVADAAQQGAWQGWADELSGLDRAVVLERPGAGRHGGPFPKIRSWFALGAPAELLSPLSLLRVLVPLVALGVPLVAVGSRVPSVTQDVAWAGLGCLAVLWGALAAVRRLERSATTWSSRALLVVLGGAMWRGRPDDVVGLLVLAVPLLVFDGMFLGAAETSGQAGVLVAWALGVAGIGHPSGLAVVAVGALGPVVGGLVGGLLARTLARVGTVDAETGLANAVGVARTVQRWGLREQRAVTLVVLAVQGLAEAQEALGHRVAGEVLRRVVEQLGTVVPPGALVGRVASEELVVALPDDRLALDPAAAGQLATALVQVVGAGRYLAGDLPVTVRAAAGVTQAPAEGQAVSELLRRAAQRARSAERTGRLVLTSDLRDREDPTGRAVHPLRPEDLALLADLRAGLARGELWLALQPQVAARTAKLVGLEALVRWRSPVHGQVPPGRFVPLAERTGLVDELTLWVLGAALDAAVRLRSAGVRVPVSVNVSARSLGIPGLADQILSALAARGLPPEALTVEITETAAFDVERAAAVLGPVHEAGVAVSIDDFGAGFTSLAALPRLPVDELKVDLAFVQRMRRSLADRAVVVAVQTLAAHLGLRSVAEGVEDDELAEELARLGYDVLQGYGPGRPMPEADLLAFVRARDLLDQPVAAEVEVS
jgi:diguanylate cyclase (GGDEF)-like protein